MPAHPRPTKAELLAARDNTVPDIIAPGLKVLFCGINPGLYSGAVGHHFARPGNRFWPALHAGGFTDRVLSPYEEGELLKSGYGITNIVPRTTATADELTDEELRQGGKAVLRKIRRYWPQFAAFVGITAYRTAFDQPKAVIGPQAVTIGDTAVWVLPNPSGLNAHHSAADLGRLFRELKEATSS